MADTKISDLAALTAVANDDLFPVVDISDTSMSADGTNKAITRANVLKGGPLDYLEYRDEKAAGTDGGTATIGSWFARVLNTEHADTGGHGSLASNQVTLLAGTYRCRAMAPGFQVTNFQLRLRNITDGTTTLVGGGAFCHSADTTVTHAFLTGRFTIAGTKVFELQERVAATKATNGLGAMANFGETEVYAVLIFEREAG